MKQYSFHTVTCGELRREDVGREVALTGWVSRRRDHGEHVFMDLRDRDGLVQISVDSDCEEAFKTAKEVRPEWPLLVKGIVQEKPEPNPKLATGEIEVIAQSIEVLNTSVTPPFPIDADDTSEDIRLRYRYLDLRRPFMQKNLRMRSDFTFALRQALHNHAFTEVETPALFKSTPEGARDFLVPSRTQPGNFYALPQSPQLLKQLLMIGGVEKYYQVVKCFRDEDLRADRQPEFTQVDIEMSFVDMDLAISELESILASAFETVGINLELPLRRMNYWDAMDTYGSDKPDTRYGMEIHDITELFAGSGFKLFATAAETDGMFVKAIKAEGAGGWARSKVDKLADVAKLHGGKGLAWIAYREDGSITSPIAKFFPGEDMDRIIEAMEAKPGDLLLFAVGDRLLCDEVLGAVRTHMADALEIKREGHDFLWVVDFPMFKYDEEEGRYAAEHHPFTMPKCDDLSDIENNPLSVGSYTYDFVMDGFEAGGGGIRIHNAEMQMQVLERMGFDKEKAEGQFGFLLEALKYGAPPMGGFALGLDRVCMLISGCDSIRDVMAFPKTTSGSDLMSQCPSAVSSEQLAELGLSVVKTEDSEN